jgi:DNA (cytosine-5)-methyltransferase 1
LVSENKSLTIATGNDQTLFLFEGNRVGDPRIHENVSPSVIARWGTGGNNVPVAFNMRSDDTTDTMNVYEAEQTTSVTALQPSPLTHRSQTLVTQELASGKNQTNTITASIYHHGTVVNQDVNDGHLIIDEPKAFDTYNQVVTDKNQTLSSAASDSSHYGTIWKDSIVRRLTPKECERLQGFPDDWTASQADSYRYKMMGNAVTVPVVEWIVNRMVKLVTE